ncbi:MULTISPECIES: HD domain-containing protein [Pseudomonas]|jgi:GTP pyrophosphokinase|uniref:HD domain-containing protein n=1 Tax=Pseudomonas helleri TaxID=1608996 RepID=A0A7X2C663_9PSED|nr:MULTISPECIES: HD domain-containing protein [Pseudomonas]MQT92002.1 HD domain-containing protein [Pseudomonas helleri]
MSPNFYPSPQIAEAVALATNLHSKQTRKGTGIPYLSHLLGVAGLVMEHGGDEEQAIAGLLHDAVEDVGAYVEAQIREQFGERVARIVLACTDGIPDETEAKGDWHVRKQRYLAHLSNAPADVLLVSACDKLHNARAIVSDLHSHGPAMFSRFNAGQESTLWYYDQLASVFQSCFPGSLSDELTRTVAEMKRLAACP